MEEDFLAQMSKMLFEVMKKIENNTDHREKKPGDKVRVWDGSANVDNKGRSRSGVDPLFNQVAILVKDDCDKRIRKLSFFNEPDGEETLDCELYFPESELTVWTKKQYLQLADFEPLP